MRIAVPKEVHAGEKRVATTPEVIGKLVKLGFSVSVETGCGESASFPDAEYAKVGAEVFTDTSRLWKEADIILKVRAPELHPTLGVHEIELMRPQQTLISFIGAGQNPELLKRLADQQVNVLAIDSVPRLSRAQKMDALSSMANIAGYRAVIEAAHHFGRFFTGQITAAGKVPPAKVLVIGAGVAGLSAIGTASGLGAIVRGFDTRREVKEQIESMGGEFLELDFKEDGSGTGGYAKVMSAEFIQAEMALFAAQAKDVDVIISTALIPGKPAPQLITAEMVRSMKQGSVIVDLAAEQGGNCELTEPGRVVVKHGVTLIGYTDLPSRLAKQSSQLYASNLWRLLEDLTPQKNGLIQINMDDEVIRGATVVLAGQVTWPPPAPKLVATPAKTKADQQSVSVKTHKPANSNSRLPLVMMLCAGAVLLMIGQVAPAAFLEQLTVFIISCFVGYMVVWNVSASLHTPLMSVTNAISGIIVIGAILQISSPNPLVQILAGVAVLVSTINIAGGFLVTHRMLKMFRK